MAHEGCHSNARILGLVHDTTHLVEWHHLSAPSPAARQFTRLFESRLSSARRFFLYSRSAVPIIPKTFGVLVN
jgi:hypothetical protein